MAKEFRALVKHKYFKEGKWLLAVPGERTYKTKEEAILAIEKAKKDGKPFSVTYFSKEKGYFKECFDSLEVIDSKIESREVTDLTADWTIE